MKSFSILARRFERDIYIMGVLLATVVLSAAPAMMASAATVTDRSIELSSSKKGATAQYNIKFTTDSASTSTGAFVIDFCTDATVGATCTAPADLSTAGVGTTGSDTVSAINSNDGVKVVLGTAVTAGNQVSVELTGITNPSATGVFYARIVTYQDGSANYNYTDPATLGAHLDDGSVALSITDGFGVHGAVLEAMTFCASGDAISDDCITTTAPDIALGTNGVLDTTASSGTVYTKISTNAASGAVVNLKSDATDCGGLVRAGAATNTVGCGIAPITGTGVTAIADSAAEFGMKLGGIAATTGAVNAQGDYNTTDFHMGYAAGNATGVTSPYGDTVYSTNDAPVDQGTANMIFSANKSNVTAAGSYSANFNLIATGKY